MTQISTSPAFAFDALSLLGFGPVSADPLPAATPSTIVIRYGGWSLQELREKHQNLFHNQDWYGKKLWNSEQFPSGIYVLRLPVPDSNRKTFDEQKALLLPGEESAPIVLAATALLAMKLSGAEDPLKDDWTRCKEQAYSAIYFALRWDDGRLGVSVWNDNRFDHLWLAAAAKTS